MAPPPEPEELTDAQRAELLEALRRLEAELTAFVQEGGAGRGGTVHLDQAAMGRVSRVDALQQQQMAQAEVRRARQRLQQIRLALAAAEDDAYGDCRRCGEPVGYRRLTIRPETPLCVACASALGA